MRRAVAAHVMVVGLIVAAGSARAQEPSEGVYVHVVRAGETLASIAQRYYGDPKRETIIVAENGLAGPGSPAIVVGMRLVIPWVGYHRVQQGETWGELAQRYYGESRRAFVLVEANKASSNALPDVNAEIIIPYPVRYFGTQGELLSRIAAQLYGSADAWRKLRRFNGIRGNRLARTQIILAPLSDLTLSDEGRRTIEEQTGVPPQAGDLRAQQAEIDETLPELRDHVQEGRFAEAVALANRLLGAGKLTGNQHVTIHRQLATAYVALGRDDLAEAAFRAALERQPDLELDALRTSPTVLEAFRRAKGGPPPEKTAAKVAPERPAKRGKR